MATIPEALAIAIQHHQAGRLQAAEQIYRQILAAEPNQPDALHLLGLIASQVGMHEVAIEYILRAIALQGNIAFYHNNLGDAYRALGRISEAAACCRRALELKPDYVDAHNNLGVALTLLGKLDEAVACFRSALELKPDYALSHNNLGNVLKGQGKPNEALACYRRALELKPDYAEAHYNLGIALKDQGKLDEAVACYRRALKLKPDYVDAHNNLGVVLMDEGKLDEALACYRRALELKPDSAEASSNLGNAFKEQGKLDEAAACYRRAREVKPDFAEAHFGLGNVLRDLGKLDEAVACYRRALELTPSFVEVYSNLGSALQEQGNLDEAVACCRRAIELKPEFAGAYGNLGGALEEMGDLQGAENSYRTALRHDCRLAFAHHRLALLLRGKLPQQDLDAQRRLLEGGHAYGEQRGLTDDQRSLLHFGLAQVLDARGEYAEAAGHADRANALQLAEWRKCGWEYDPQEHESFVTRMIGLCTLDFFERVRGFGLQSEVPVFVVGLPRSGTSLIEQILASHSQVFGAGELALAGDTMDALGGQSADFITGLGQMDHQMAHRLASRHLERLRGLNPAALRIEDKMPDNYLLLGLLASLFPRAKLIHCRRDLRDVAVSCWMTHFREIRWTNDQQHIASRFHAYQRIMAHWRTVLPLPLLEVDYEETVTDLEGVARKLVAWCGLAWEPSCLEFPPDKAAGQNGQRRPSAPAGL